MGEVTGTVIFVALIVYVALVGLGLWVTYLIIRMAVVDALREHEIRLANGSIDAEIERRRQRDARNH
ncbi:hypothetical protein [Microbacterium sp. SORGH_AS_0888]|uniref:hypothetical protein n=1 Tax=Microbacterium sp. SORGH_AS_0888 TaxID=3041791 RepID=UPI0027833CF0|nr:hypothetical protein [Microbacterium sp. SORGH_AS_0888]MDQ1130666.1 type IV secretory pathway TrbD component [Microbacterium sp. SORGH_AS_0888]